jgi:acetate kinase
VTYPLPKAYLERHGIRRFGFHGTSCRWSLGMAAQFLGRPKEALNVIVAHLGAGASVTAIRAGKSIDTSMGLSPLEGVMMQTRAGDLDPGALILLLRGGMPVDELDRVLNHDSGVKGIAGEADMRTVERRASSGDADAAFAREMYVYRAAKYVGAYAGLVWPLNAVVFTGGIGEHDSSIRAAICAALPQLGLSLDPVFNVQPPSERVYSIRSVNGSGPEILVVEADEELEIARETVAVVRTIQRAARS